MPRREWIERSGLGWLVLALGSLFVAPFALLVAVLRLWRRFRC